MSVWYEGKAADGTHVLFTVDPYINRADRELFVNGAPVEIESVQRFRDGGTTLVKTPIGTFKWPSPLKHGEPTTFAGKTLTPVYHSGSQKIEQINRISFDDLDKLLEKLANSSPKDRDLKGYLGGYMSALLDIREELKL